MFSKNKCGLDFIDMKLNLSAIIHHHNSVQVSKLVTNKCKVFLPIFYLYFKVFGHCYLTLLPFSVLCSKMLGQCLPNSQCCPEHPLGHHPPLLLQKG